jgi:hypothetical protein
MLIPARFHIMITLRELSRRFEQTTQDGNSPYSSSLKFGFPASFIDLLENVLKPARPHNITMQHTHIIRPILYKTSNR